MIRTAQDVLDAAKARGFEVKMKPGPPPMPYLFGNKAEATAALMEALMAFRPEILELLAAQEPSKPHAVEPPPLPETMTVESSESPTDQAPLPMEDSELPRDVPANVSLLFRAGGDTIQSTPLWKENQ